MENAFAQETLNQTADISAEEINARKQEMLDFYKEQIEFMTTQLEFEKMSADIEEQRLRRLVALVRQAQIQSPPDQEEMPTPEEYEEQKRSQPKRTLKKS